MLTNLKILDLSDNKLMGEIPGDIVQISGLQNFSVSDSQLSGKIPTLLGSRFPSSSFAGNTGFCGEPLARDYGEKKRKTARLLILIVVVAGSVIACCLAACCCLLMVAWLRRRAAMNGGKKRSPARSSNAEAAAGMNGCNGGKLIVFNNRIPYAETLEATRQFDEEHVLSRGRNGVVFKAGS